MSADPHSRTVQHPPRLQALKAATKALVSAFGGQVAAGERLGRRHQHYSDVGLPNTSHFISIEDVIDLESETHGMAGHPHVTRALARAQGFALVRADAGDQAPEDWHSHIAGLAKMAGGLISDISQSLADDGNICTGDVAQRDMLAESAQLLDVSAALHAALRAVAQ